MIPIKMEYVRGAWTDRGREVLYRVTYSSGDVRVQWFLQPDKVNRFQLEPFKP